MRPKDSSGRYIVSRNESAEASVARLLEDYPGVTVVRVLDRESVLVNMSASVALEIGRSHPQLEIQEDFKHSRYDARP